MDFPPKRFSKEIVESLSTMKSLSYLRIYIDFFRKEEGENKYLPVHAAGRVPNLLRFGLYFKNIHTMEEGYFTEFIDRYDKFYPGKKLSLENLW
jgi:hypothetical protein